MLEHNLSALPDWTAGSTPSIGRPRRSASLAGLGGIILSCIVASAEAAPITAILQGEIIEVPTADFTIGPDVAGLISANDAADVIVRWDPDIAVQSADFGDTIIYGGAIISMEVSLNNGAIVFAFDPAGGAHLSHILVSSDSSGGQFVAQNSTAVIEAGDGSSGAVTGPVIPSSHPNLDTDWRPALIVVRFAREDDITVVPSAPEFVSGMVSWMAFGDLFGSGSQWNQSNISFRFTSVEFLLDDDSATAAPEPETLALFAAGLGLLAAGRRRRAPAA